MYEITLLGDVGPKATPFMAQSIPNVGDTVVVLDSGVHGLNDKQLFVTKVTQPAGSEWRLDMTGRETTYKPVRRAFVTVELR